MSLKRRNGIACCLLLLAAICWTFGYRMVQSGSGESGIVAASYSSIEATTYPTSTPATLATEYIPNETTPADETVEETNGGNKFLGFLLCFVSAASAGIAVIGFWQTAPILGPDGVSMLAAIECTAYDTLQNVEYILWTSSFLTLTTYANILTGFTVLFALRELWGWIRAKFSLSWCLAYRIAKRSPKPQLSLLVFVGWIGIGYHLIWFGRRNEISFWSLIAATVFCFLCLWNYGADLEHFKQQLNSFQRGLPITVGDGAFAQTEAQLLDVQTQHEEAVRTAVTSERFKVELISNVSHDLRTPLTAILGYSELLQKEALSPEGQE